VLGPRAQPTRQDGLEQPVLAADVLVQGRDGDAGRVGDPVHTGDGDAIGEEQLLRRVEDAVSGPGRRHPNSITLVMI
jgi:hypothetical protein